MKYRGLKAAAAATKRDADNVTNVAIILRGDTVETRTIMAGGWLKAEDADKVIYAKRPMTMAQIEAELSGEPYQTPQARYDATNTVQVALKLNRRTDADIIARLEREPNKQSYIKALIRNNSWKDIIRADILKGAAK